VIRSYYDTLCDTNPDISEKHLIGTVEKHFEQCLRVYHSMDENASQKEVHRLRVDFKNARYGFEFLREAGLWDEPEKISACKKLQTALGAVQDAYNQIDWLKKLYRRHPCSETEKLLKERKSGLKKLKAASRSARSPERSDTRSSS
jgi:CHAD domain-containing protein